MENVIFLKEEARTAEESFLISGSAFSAAFSCGFRKERILLMKNLFAPEADAVLEIDGNFLRSEKICAYSRTMLLSQNLILTSFTRDKIRNRREFFLSAQNSLLIGKIETDHAHALNLDFSIFSSQKNCQTVADASKGIILISGETPDYFFCYQARIMTFEGTLSSDDEHHLICYGADSVEIRLSGSFCGKNPLQDDCFPVLYRNSSAELAFAAFHSHEWLLAAHGKVISASFRKTMLSLNSNAKENAETTAARIKNYDGYDSGLVELLFNRDKMLTQPQSGQQGLPWIELQTRICGFASGKIVKSSCVDLVRDLLVRISGETIFLLADLPETWKDGSVSGLSIPGYGVLDMIWEKTQLQTAIFHSCKYGMIRFLTKNPAEVSISGSAMKYQGPFLIYPGQICILKSFSHSADA